MLEHKQKPTEAAFAVGIKAAGQLSKPDFARMLLAERCRARFRPKEELYVTVSGEHYVEKHASVTDRPRTFLRRGGFTVS